MRIDTHKLIPQTLTILNRIPNGNTDHSDLWVKHTLYNCVWKSEQIAEQVGTQINIGQTISIQIPRQSNVSYLPFKEFIAGGVYTNTFTLSLGDYIVLGDVTEAITSSNIVSVLKTYEPNVCKVSRWEDLRFDGLTLPTFLTQYASILSVEGV